jgi:hypothetical protein
VGEGEVSDRLTSRPLADLAGDPVAWVLLIGLLLGIAILGTAVVPVPLAAAQTMTTPKAYGLPGWCRVGEVDSDRRKSLDRTCAVMTTGQLTISEGADFSLNTHQTLGGRSHMRLAVRRWPLTSTWTPAR